jgi:hypothetical protein
MGYSAKSKRIESRKGRPRLKCHPRDRCARGFGFKRNSLLYSRITQVRCSIYWRSSLNFSVEVSQTLFNPASTWSLASYFPIHLINSNMLLCRFCSNISLHKQRSWHHSTFADLSRSAQTCELCRLFLQKIEPVHVEWIANGADSRTFVPLHVRPINTHAFKKLEYFPDIVLSDFRPDTQGQWSGFPFELVAHEGVLTLPEGVFYVKRFESPPLVQQS